MSTRAQIVKELLAAVKAGALPQFTAGKPVTTEDLKALVSGRAPSDATMKRAVRDLSEMGVFRSAGRKGLIVTQRSKRLGGPQIIAVVVSEVEDPFFSGVLLGLTREAQRHNYRIVVYNSNRSSEAERAAILDFLEWTAGVIVIAVGDGAHLAEIVARAGDRLVMVERRFSSAARFPLIASDNAAGGALAAQMLISGLANSGAKGGDLFIIGRSENNDGQIARRDGFVEELAARNHGLQKKLQFRLAEPMWLRPESCSYRDLAARLDHVLKGGSDFWNKVREARKAREERRPRPVGVFCLADAIAISLFGLVTGSKEGYAVPGDVMIVGFDDLFFAEAVGLATIQQDFPTLGERAVRVLLDGVPVKEAGEDLEPTPVTPQWRATVRWPRASMTASDRTK
jgi:DNA-binding LacI/PurR family transcriptional regulator